MLHFLFVCEIRMICSLHIVNQCFRNAYYKWNSRICTNGLILSITTIVFYQSDCNICACYGERLSILQLSVFNFVRYSDLRHDVMISCSNFRLYIETVMLSTLTNSNIMRHEMLQVYISRSFSIFC